MAHGFLARAMCFAHPGASWAVCLAHSLCWEGCWISLGTVCFEVTGELPETTFAELIGDQDLHGLQCMQGVGSECWSSEMRFWEYQPKITPNHAFPLILAVTVIH